ncbi:hypothetical protein HK099_004961 [Clydaea vesicula]|uniref:Uncharacterized protein n=1 Tax=Clydaea vesicula TaxID=447962 RepID=A0AAD5U4E0_9FUNG|nr:hypothetical protein HK099_004961 [Clydaea vesicula]
METVVLINKSLKSVQEVLDEKNLNQREASKVKYLNLHSNSFASFNNFNLFYNLINLNLSSNKIKNINVLLNFPILEVLNLSNNEISQICNLDELKNLKNLDLSFNRIRSFNGLHNIKNKSNLIYLNLKCNILKNDISEVNFLKGFKNLKHLVLQSSHTKKLINDSTFMSKNQKFNPLLENPRLYSELNSIGLQNINLDDSFEIGDINRDTYENLLINEKEIFFFKNLPNKYESNEVKADLSENEDNFPSQKNVNTKNEQKKSKSEKIASKIPVSKQKLDETLPLNNEPIQGAELSQPLHSQLYLESVIDRLLFMKKEEDTKNEKAALLAELKMLKEEKEATENKYVNFVSSDENDEKGSEPSVSRNKENRSNFVGAKKIHRNDTFRNTKSGGKINRPKLHTKKSTISTKENISTSFNDSSSSTTSSRIQHQNLLNNSILISALEKEEKRLKEVEVELRSQLKEVEVQLSNKNAHYEKLNENLATNIKNVKLEKLYFKEKEISELKKKEREVLELEFSQCQKNYAAYKDKVAELEKHNHELKSNCEMLKNYEKLKDAEIQHLRKSACDAEIGLANFEGKLKMFEDEKARLSVRFVKDRELYKIKLAEEIEIYRISLKQLKQDLGISKKHLKESTGTLKEEIEKLIFKHKEELQEVKLQSFNEKCKFDKVEKEFLNHMKMEYQKCDNLQKSYDEIIEKFQNQTEKIKIFSKNEEEYNQLIGELTDVVKSQKNSIENLTLEKKQNFETIDKLIQNLELEQKNCYELRSQLKKEIEITSNLRTEKESLQSEISRLKLDIDTKNNLVTKSEADSEEKKIKFLAFNNEMESLKHALEVKNKMLEDQNETIRNLKKNLENKTNDQHSIASKLKNDIDELKEQLLAEQDLNDELQYQLEKKGNLIDNMKPLVDEYKLEKDKLKRDLIELQKKLKDRNEAILRIEEEVFKIKGTFKAKEEKLIENYKLKITEQEVVIKDMEFLLEDQRKKFGSWIHEKEALLKTIDHLKKNNELLVAIKQDHDKEMVLVLKELENQKNINYLKIQKMKEIFSL